MFGRITALIVVLLVASTAIAAPAEAAPKRPWVTVKASSSTVAVGSAVTLSGKVGRHAPRQQLRLQRASGPRWVTVSTRTLPRASKTRSHRFRVTVNQAGRQKFRVLLAKKGKVRAIASRTVVVTGRRPVPPKPTPSPTPTTPAPSPPAPRLQAVPGGTGVDGIGVSANGRWVVYRKVRAVGDDAASDVFLVDMVTGATVQVTKAMGSAETDGWSFQSSVSDDGNWVAYSSEATNLVLGDTNATRDVFLWSRATQTTTLVSRGADGAPADNWSQGPDVSGDGSVVVFSSNADNLAPGSTPEFEELFAWHRDTGVTTRLSDGESGPLGTSFNSLGVSTDGSTAVFESRTIYERTIYLRSLSSGELTRVREGRRPVVSADGRQVAYLGASSWGEAVETWDALTDTTTRVSVRLDGQDPRDMVAKLSISADGRWITFLTSDQVTEDDVNGRRDAFLWDRTTGRATLVSSPTDRKPATEEARDAVVSADGAYVIFQSQEPAAVVGKPEVLYRWARTSGS